jgi:hypothetical protein
VIQFVEVLWLIIIGIYVARPYNFNVSPLFTDDERLGINRDFTLSSSAIQFLQRNHFDVGAIFRSGVPYLSRTEDETARKVYTQKEDRSANIADLVISPSDNEALNFYRKARETVGLLKDKKTVSC